MNGLIAIGLVFGICGLLGVAFGLGRYTTRPEPHLCPPSIPTQLGVDLHEDKITIRTPPQENDAKIMLVEGMNFTLSFDKENDKWIINIH